MGTIDIEITHPSEEELETTLRFAFQHLSPEELPLRINALLQHYHSGGRDFSTIFQAKNEKTLVGALYAQCRPDGSVMLWVPAAAKGFSAEPLFESLATFCRVHHAYAAVALADRNQPFDEQMLCTVGQFRFLSDLVHLAVEISPQESLQEPSRLQFVPLSDYSENTAERLTQLVKRTYQNSLDFPELMQIAPVESVLCGYQIGSLFRPELWFFIQKEGYDVGALLLTDIPPDQFELTYVGLIESERRQGFSGEIIRFAKSVTRRWNRTLLLTAADGKNVPACQCYLSQGFKAWDRKKVFARFF